MANSKYRVHEIAKDMGVTSNEVLEIINQYFPLPCRKVPFHLEVLWYNEPKAFLSR